jgi:hypothetical protein
VNRLVIALLVTLPLAGCGQAPEEPKPGVPARPRPRRCRR